MNLETWLSLYKKTGESREDAVDRYIVEQGITDPAEKESLKGQLTTPDPITPAPVDYFDDTPGARYRDEFFGPEFDLDRQQEFMPPSPEEEYVADPSALQQLGASWDTAHAGIYSAIGGQAGGALEDLDYPEEAAQVRDWAEAGRAEQQRQADLIAYPKSSEEILKEDPESFYKYLPEYVPSGHEYIRTSIPSLTPYAMGLGLSVGSAPLLAAAGLTGIGLAVASGLTGMSLTNLASSFYVSGQEYERIRDDPSVREGMGIDPSTRFEDLPSDQKRLLTQLRHDMAQTTFGRRLYTAGLVEMLSFARYGGKLFRWGADMVLGATSEVWDEALYAENAANTMVEYGIPLDVAQRMREKIISLGPSQKKLWTQSLFYEGVYGGGFLAAEHMAGDKRIDGWATSSKKQQEIQEEFQKNRNKIKLKSEEQALLGTDTKRRQQAARDAVALESGYKNWEDMEAQEKSIQNAYKFKAGSDAYRARQASEKKVRELEAKAELKSQKEQEDYGRDEVAQMIRAEEQSIRLARGTDFTATRKALEREQEVLDNIRSRLPSSTSPVRKDGTLLTSEEIFDINAIRRKRETQLLNLQKRQAALDKAEKEFEKAHPLKTGEQLERQTKREARKEVDRPKVQVLKSTIEATTTGEVTTERGVLKRLFDMYQSKTKVKYVILDKTDETRLANIFGGPEYLADAQGHLQGSEGFVHEGIVYLVADNIKGATPSEAINRAVQVGIFHEPIAHLGIRKVLGDAGFKTFLDDFYASNTQDIHDWARTEVTPEGVPAYLDEDYDPDLLRKPSLRQRLKLKKKLDTGLSVDKKRELAEEYLAHKFTEYGVRDPHILERLDDSLKTSFSAIVGKKRVSKIQARTLLASIQRQYIGGKRNIITGDFFDPSHWVKSKPLALVEEEQKEETEQTAEEKVEAYREHLRKGAKADVTPIGTEELLTEDVEEAREAKREAGFVHPNVQAELDRVETNKQARIKAEAKKLKEKKQKAKEKAAQEALSILGIRASKRTMSLRDAQAWAAKPENQKGKGRRPRVPELASLAKTLKKGDTTYEEYQDAVDRHLPIEKFEAVPEVATDEEILGSIKSRQYKDGILLDEAGLDVDELVDVRLDIPAYERFNTWIATITRSPRKGTPKIYGGTAHLKNVEFKTSLAGALRIAEGEQKGTIATMRGDWQVTSKEDIKKLAGVRANKSAWIEIGYNPERQSTFYIKEDKGGFTRGTPLASAEEVMQIGGYVLAKRPVTKAVPSQVIDGKTIRFAKLKVKAYGGTAQVEDNVIEALKANPKLAPLIKYMTPEELDLLSPKSADRMVATLEGRKGIAIVPGETGLNTEELISMALAGQIHKGWYISSLGAVNHVFGADAPRFLGLLAALSPKSTVENSALEAANLWSAWIGANRPTNKTDILKLATKAISRFDGMQRVLSGNTIRTLTAKNPKKLILSGPKVQSFHINLMGNLDEVTHDVWQWNAYGILGTKIGANILPSGLSIKMPTYTIASAKLREAADMLTTETGQTWKPAEVQETIWSFYKALMEFSAAQPRRKGRTLEEVVTQEDLTQQIQQIPDFATLLDGTAPQKGSARDYASLINNILTKAGYGKQIATIVTQPVLTQAMGGVTPTYGVRGIGKVGRRLEAARPKWASELAADRKAKKEETLKARKKSISKTRKSVERIRASKKTKQWTEEKKGADTGQEGEMQPFELAYLDWSEQWFNYGPGNKPNITNMEDLIGISVMDFIIHRQLLTGQIRQLDKLMDKPLSGSKMNDLTWNEKNIREYFEAYKKDQIKRNDPPWYTLAGRNEASTPLVGEQLRREVKGVVRTNYEIAFKAYDNVKLPPRIENLRRHIDYANSHLDALNNNNRLREAFQDVAGTVTEADLEGASARLYKIVEEEHEIIHHENWNYLDNTYARNPEDGVGANKLFMSAMMRALSLDIGKSEITPPPKIEGTGRALAHTYNRFRAGEYSSLKHMRNDYLETALRHQEEAMKEAKMVGEPVLTLEGGKWEELPMLYDEDKGTSKEEEIYDYWRKHSHHTWCTFDQGFEKTFSPQGPMWVYERNGKFLLGLRFISDNTAKIPNSLESLREGKTKIQITEIQGQNNNSTIIPEMAPAVNEFLAAKEKEWGVKIDINYQPKRVIDEATERMVAMSKVNELLVDKAKWKARDDKTVTVNRTVQRMFLAEMKDSDGYAARWDGTIQFPMDLIPDPEKFPIHILANNAHLPYTSVDYLNPTLELAAGDLNFEGENIRLALLGEDKFSKGLPNLHTVYGEFETGINSQSLMRLFETDATLTHKALQKRRVQFEQLQTVNALEVAHAVDLPGLIAVPGRVKLKGDATAINLETAGNVTIERGGDYDDTWNKDLATQGLPSLKNIDKNFEYIVEYRENYWKSKDRNTWPSSWLNGGGIDFNNLETIGENMVLSPAVDKADYLGKESTAKPLQFKTLHHIGGDLQHAQGADMNPDFDSLYSVVGDIVVHRRYRESQGERVDWFDRFDKNGFSAPNLTLVGGDIEVYANSYLPNLQRVGKDIHIYIDQKERDDYSKRDTLADVKELLPSLTHVGGEIIIHMKEDTSYRAKRFLHIGGRISTLEWEDVSHDGMNLITRDAWHQEQRRDPVEIRKLKNETWLSKKQEGFVDWGQALFRDEDFKHDVYTVPLEGARTNVQTFKKIAPNLKFIGSQRFAHKVDEKRMHELSHADPTDTWARKNDRESRDGIVVKEDADVAHDAIQTLIDHYTKKKVRRVPTEFGLRHLLGDALKGTDLDPRTRRLLRFSRIAKKPSAKELEAEWRKRRGKPTARLPKEKPAKDKVTLSKEGRALTRASKLTQKIDARTQESMDFAEHIVLRHKKPSTLVSRTLDKIKKLGKVNELNPDEIIIGKTAIEVVADPDGKSIWYKDIRAFEKGKGHATKTMKLVQDVAMEAGVNLTSHVEAFGEGGMTNKQLDKWYRRLGWTDGDREGEIMFRGEFVVLGKKMRTIPMDEESAKIIESKPTAKDLTPEAILDPKGNVRSSKVLMSRAAKHAIDTRSKSWNPLTRWTGFAQPFADRLTSRLVSQGTLPDSAKYKALRRRVKGIILAGETAGKKVYDALKKSKQKELIFKYLTTKGFDPNQIKDLGERQTAISAKKQINEIGEMLVERKLMKRKTKEQYEGEYLPKVYLKYLLGEDNFRKATTKGGLGLDMSYLIGRKDIPEGIRKLILGEIEDPGYLASKAVSVPQKDIAIIDWLKTIAGNANWVLPSSLINYDVLGKMKSLTASVDLQKQLELIDTEGSQVSAFWLANEADRIFTQTKLMDLSETERQIVIDLTEDMKAQAQAQIKETEGKINPKLYSLVPTTPKYGQLAGMAVRKEIAQDIFGSMSMATGDISLAESVFGDGGKVGDYNRIWKWSKVSANPPSWVRNFVSNLTLMNMGGVPFVRMPDLMLSSLADMLKKGKHKGRLHQLAKDIGLTSGNFSSAELGRIETEFKDLMQRMSAKEKAGMRVLGPIKGAFNVVRDSTSNLYGGIDSLGKMMMLKYNMDKAGLNVKDIGAYSPTEMALLNDAAYDAEKYLFDYSNPLPSVKWLRRAPFGAPFISFTSFALPLVLETAITKPWKFLPYYLLGYSAKELFKSLNDLDEEDYEGLKVSMSDYLREKAEGAGPYPVIPWPYIDENGRIQFIDVSYLYPWGMFSEVLGELFSGDFGKAIRTAGLMGSPAVTTASAIISGVDGFTRQPIVDDFGTWDEQAADIGWFAFNLTMPPMLHGVGQGPNQGYGAVKRMWDAFHGQLNKEGEARFTMPQATARMAGINITPIAVPEGRNKQLRYEYSRIQKLLRLAKRDIVNMIMMQESKEDIQEAAKDYRGKIQNMVGDFQERIKKSTPPISLLRKREAVLKKRRDALQIRRSG